MFGLEQWAQASEAFFLLHQSFTNLTIGCVIVFGLIINLIKSRPIFANYPPVGWLILLLFLYAFISASWAPRPDLSYEVWAKAWPYIITFVVLAPLLITRLPDLEPVFLLIIVMGGVLALLLTFGVEWHFRRIVLSARFGGEVYGNPLAVAQMAGNVVFAALLLKGRKTKKYFDPIKWVLAAICLVLIIKSGSRGQLIALFLSLIVTWPLAHSIQNFKGFLFALGLLAIVFFVSSWALTEFWGKTDRWSDQSMNEAVGGRLDQAFVLLTHWLKNVFTIFFGLGNSASYDPRIIGLYPHFVPLEILGEEGLIGFSLYLYIIFSGIKSAVESYSLTKNSDQARQLLAVLCSMSIYAFLLSLKQGSLLSNLEFFMFIILLVKYEILLKNSIVEFQQKQYAKHRVEKTNLLNT